MKVVISVSCSAFKSTQVGVTYFSLYEEMNRPYVVNLDVVTRTAELDAAALVGEAIKVTWYEPGGRILDGVIVELSERPSDTAHRNNYSIVIRPLLYRASYSISNRIFLDKSVPDIVESILGDHKVPFEWKLQNRDLYPLRAFTVQYGESDLDFANRLLEEEGIGYFFSIQGKLVLGDHMKAFDDIKPDAKISYIPSAAGDASNPSIASLSFSQSLVPQKLVMDDFIPASPDTVIHAEEEAEFGVGQVNLRDKGYMIRDDEKKLTNDSSLTERLAKLRFEELKFHAQQIEGEGTVASFGPGMGFTLAKHPIAKKNARYLICSVFHEIIQSFAGAFSDPGAARYGNRFSMSSVTLPYRPACRTPRPMLHGVMRATIESSKSMPQIDDEGRYQVRMPFDLEKTKIAKASKEIELVRPYAASPSINKDGDKGTEAGFDFPLANGTVVVWAALDGNLDRPVILGALPSRSKKAPLARSEDVDHGLATAAGHTIKFKDTANGWQLKANAIEQKPGVGFIELVSPSGPSRLTVGGLNPGRGVLLSCDEPQSKVFLGRQTDSMLTNIECSAQIADAAFVSGEVTDDHNGFILKTDQNNSGLEAGEFKVEKANVEGLRFSTDKGDCEMTLGNAGKQTGLLIRTGETAQVHGEQGVVVSAFESIEATGKEAAAADKEFGNVQKALLKDADKHNNTLKLQLSSAGAKEHLKASKKPKVSQSKAVASYIDDTGEGNLLWGPKICSMVLKELTADEENDLPGVCVLAPEGVHIISPDGPVTGFGTRAMGVGALSKLTIASHVAASISSLYGPVIVRAQKGNVLLYSKKGAVGLSSADGKAELMAIKEVLLRAGTKKDKSPSISCKGKGIEATVDKTKVAIEMLKMTADTKELSIDADKINKSALKMTIDAGKTLTITSGNISLTPG